MNGKSEDFLIENVDKFKESEEHVLFIGILGKESVKNDK